MDVDVIGRVNHTRLATRNALHSVYEAVVNSIHAIEELQEKHDAEYRGRITIRIRRSSQSEAFEGYNRDIEGFDIEDNGIGFTADNYESFQTSDSRRKEDIGGQGVGRLLWLKVFDRAEIESIYHTDHATRKRSFEFELTEDGIKNHEDKEVSDDKDLTTVVRLRDINDRYRNDFPAKQQTIALRIVEHCLEFFVLDRSPEIYIYDEDSDESVNLENVYQRIVNESKLDEFTIGKSEFKIRHFLLNMNSKYDHQVKYCANYRVVTDTKLIDKINDLPNTVPKDGDELIYRGYGFSKYLDENVSQERTSFDLSEDGFFAGSTSMETVEKEFTKRSEGYLDEFLEPIRKDKKEKVRRYTSEDAPQFRHVIKHKPGVVNELPPNPTDEQIDRKLYEASKKIEIENRKKAKELINGTVDENEDEVEIKRKYEEFLDELNDVAKSNLAKYITNRRMNLDLLSSRLERRGSGKYALEDLIHEMIFPLRSSSDEVSYEDQNLWILDEKLAFHHYLASDKAFEDMEVVESESRERPDLLIFDNPIAVSEDQDPHTGVDIFEFKRPMRDDYRSDENPIAQVLRYVERIQDGEVTDRRGRPLNVTDTTPFHCYIVADITKSLRRQAENAGYFETPDGEGFYGYTEARNAYVEVVSFDKVVRDAKRRNAILFEKLNLDY